MDKLLEIQFSGWTATPRLPFIISGSKDGGSVCMHTPTYSLLLGIIGCCLGRIVISSELKLGFKYSYDTVNKDMETRQRLENKGKIRKHPDGSSPYLMEFHSNPKLTIWLSRIDWKSFFENPIGTPSLGRSQDILKIDSVSIIEVEKTKNGNMGGSLLPFTPGLQAGGQLVQLAESYLENEEVGSGRVTQGSKVFISIPHDNNAEVTFNNIYKTKTDNPVAFYLHEFQYE